MDNWEVYYTSFLCAPTTNSNYALLLIKPNYPHLLQPHFSNNWLAWTPSEQIVLFQSSILSGSGVSIWYTSPDWLVSIGLLSSGPSPSSYHSTVFPHIKFGYSYHTGHIWCQLTVISYRGDDSRHHSLSVFLVNIAICIYAEIRYHCSCDNTWGWVVMMWLKNICLAVIGVETVLTYNW